MKPPRGPLASVAVGDAYGFQFEYRKGNWAPLNTGAAYTQHPTHADAKPGHYSDDTQMSLAVAHLLLTASASTRRIPPSHAIGDAFTQVYRNDPRVGYSRGMVEALNKALRGKHNLVEVCMEFGRSEKSGAAMRATPLGLLAQTPQLREFARYQGAVTHSGEALDAAEAVALAAHYMLHRLGPRSGMPAFVAAQMQNDVWRKPWRSKVGSPGMESARAALTAVVQASSLRDVLIRSCAFTGDVDTVAAIAMGCAWRYPDLADDLPESLWDGMEDGPYGRTYLAEQDSLLLAAYPLPA